MKLRFLWTCSFVSLLFIGQIFAEEGEIKIESSQKTYDVDDFEFNAKSKSYERNLRLYEEQLEIQRSSEDIIQRQEEECFKSFEELLKEKTDNIESKDSLLSELREKMEELVAIKKQRVEVTGKYKQTLDKLKDFLKESNVNPLVTNEEKKEEEIKFEDEKNSESESNTSSMETQEESKTEKELEVKDLMSEEKEGQEPNNTEVSEQNTNSQGNFDWKAVKDYAKTLNIYHKALRRYDVRESTVNKYGKKCFEDYNVKELFDGNKNAVADMNVVLLRVSESGVAANNAWLEIKDLKKEDKDYNSKLDNLREAIKVFVKDVSALVKLGKRLV